MTESDSDIFGKLVEQADSPHADAGEPRPFVLTKRHRQHRPSFNRRLGHWWSRHSFKFVIAGLFLLIVVLLLYPFDQLAADSPPGRTFGWLAYGYLAQLLAFVILAGIGFLSWRHLRRLINWDTELWADHCPNCHSDRLKRVHRHRRDHLIAASGIPLRRYICANCHWHGVRVDETRI